MEYRATNELVLGSEHSIVNEPQNPTTAINILLLPLEADFSNISDPSIVLKPPSTNWRLDNLQVSQSRHMSRRDQTKSTHKSRKRRRHRSSSSSSSSRSSSSDSCKCSRKSKRSIHSHKRRRRQGMSSSMLNRSAKDYGRYKSSKQTMQVAEAPTVLQPAETTYVTPIPQPENTAEHSAKDSDSEPEQEIWSFDTAINEVFTCRLASGVMS